MSYQQLDKIADYSSPVLGLIIFGLAVYQLRGQAWLFLLRTVVATAVVQQIAKYVQKHNHFDKNFPSTHYAVALALAISLVALKRSYWPYALAFLLAYGALMLFQHYHTPSEMLAAFYAVPIALLFQWKPKRATGETAVASNN